MTVASDHPSKTDRAGWKALRAAVLARADNRCERCKAPNRDVISRLPDDPGTYMTFAGDVYNDRGEHQGSCRGSEWPSRHVATVVLTIAHLDDDGGPCNCEPACLRDDHVQALCQRCHNVLDGPKRRRNAAKTRRRRGGQSALPGLDP